jgi:hypothetical protein
MTDETTNIDDLFAADGDDTPGPDAKPKRKPRAAAKPKVAVEDLSDDDLANLAATDTRKTVRAAAEAEITRRADSPAAAPDRNELIDNAVNIRRLDWECECGNTNTLDLQRCGKCRSHRYTN